MSKRIDSTCPFPPAHCLYFWLSSFHTGDGYSYGLHYLRFQFHHLCRPLRLTHQASKTGHFCNRQRGKRTNDRMSSSQNSKSSWQEEQGAYFVSGLKMNIFLFQTENDFSKDTVRSEVVSDTSEILNLCLSSFWYSVMSCCIMCFVMHITGWQASLVRAVFNFTFWAHSISLRSIYSSVSYYKLFVKRAFTCNNFLPYKRPFTLDIKLQWHAKTAKVISLCPPAWLHWIWSVRPEASMWNVFHDTVADRLFERGKEEDNSIV